VQWRITNIGYTKFARSANLSEARRGARAFILPESARIRAKQKGEYNEPFAKSARTGATKALCGEERSV